MGHMIIYLKEYPFKDKPIHVIIEAGGTVADLSAEIAKSLPDHLIDINGRLIDPERYGDTIISENDLVLVCGLPQTGVELAVILTQIAIAVVMAGITIAVTYLLRPKALGQGGPQDQRHSITGFGNQIGAFTPIPKGAGIIRTYPKFPGIHPTQHTEIVGDDQYTRGYLLVGKGPVTIPREEIRFGETAIDNFQDLELEIFEGKPTDPPNTLYNRTVIEDSLSGGIELTQANGWHVRTTEPNTRRISIDWTFPRGLQYVQKDGDRKNQTVSIQIEVKVGETWIRRTGVNQLNSTTAIRVRSTGSDTRTVTVWGYRLGVEVSESLVLNGTFLVEGTQLFDLISWKTTLSSEDLSREVFVNRMDNGHLVCEVGAHRVSGNTTAAIRRNHSWDVSEGQYDVRLRRLTNASGSREVDESWWTALRSFKDEQPFNEPNAAGIAYRIRATGQINGLIDNCNVLTKWEYPVWNGSAWSAPVITQNPAWCCVGVLTGNGNRRPIPLSEINEDSFLEFANWCDAEGFKVNHIWESSGNAWDVAQVIAATGRGSLDTVDGKYVVVIDRQQTEISNHFTPYNTWDMEGGGTYPEEVHGLRIAFKNELLDFADDERIVYDDGYDKNNATLFDFLTWVAVTHPDQIWKLGRYELADRKLQFQRWSFNMDAEQLASTRGDLGLLSHDGILVGLGWGLTSRHESAPAGVTAITIDNAMTFDPAKSYGVNIRKTSSRTTFTVQIVNPGKTTNRFEFLVPLAGLLGEGIGCLVTVGEWGKIAERVIIKAIEKREESGHLAARLTVAKEAAGRYTADQMAIPPHTSLITIPTHPLNLRPPMPIIRSIRSDESVALTQDNGSRSAHMVIDTRFESGFSPGMVNIQAQYRRWIDPEIYNAHPWIITPMQDGENGEIVIQNVEVILIYEVRVRSINKLNQSLISAWTATQTHEVMGDTIPPGMPTDVFGQSMDRTASIRWVNPMDETGLKEEADFAAVEIWRGTTNDRAAASYIGETSGQNWVDEKLVNGTTYYYWLRARDWAGNPSEWHSSQFSGLNITPAANVVVNKAEVRSASKTLSTLDSSVLSLAYAAKGHKVTVRAKMYIFADSNDPSATEFCEISLTKNGSVVDSYNLSFKHLGLGYPGEINLVYEDLPTVATHTYRIAYAGSTAVAKAVNLGIFVEETEV